MVRKVKDTPVLTGKDAKAFAQAIKDNVTKKVSSSDFRRAQVNFKRFQFAEAYGKELNKLAEAEQRGYDRGWNSALLYMEEWFTSVKSKAGRECIWREAAAYQCRKVREGMK